MGLELLVPASSAFSNRFHPASWNYFMQNSANPRKSDLQGAGFRPGRLREGVHIPALDGLRGLAVVLVILYHCSYHNITDSPLLAGLVRVFRAGWCGVDLFFVLSGFLITGILIDSKNREHYFRSFYLRRTLRIFPLYYLVLACFFVLAPALNLVQHESLTVSSWWFLWYGQNFLFARHGFEVLSNAVPLHHFWSLAIEEHFYLVWPAVIFWVPNRWHLVTAGGLALGVLACRFAFSVPEGGVLPCPNYVLTPCRVDGMLLGAMSAMLVRGHWPVGRLMISCGVVGLLALGGLGGIAMHTGGFRFQANPMDTWGFSGLALLFASLILAIGVVNPASPFLRPLSRGVLCFFGKYSYALYVFHPMVDHALKGVLPPPTTAGAWLMHVAALFLLSIGSALVSWHLLEKHFLRWKVHFPAGAPRVA